MVRYFRARGLSNLRRNLVVGVLRAALHCLEPAGNAVTTLFHGVFRLVRQIIGALTQIVTGLFAAHRGKKIPSPKPIPIPAKKLFIVKVPPKECVLSNAAQQV